MLLLSVAILLSKQLILMFVIGFFYSVSHDVLQLDSIKTVPLRRSLVDNLTHIIIGVFSWLLCISYEKLCHPWNIANCLLCGFFASIVDIDHFLMAKSLKLNCFIMELPQNRFSKCQTTWLLREDTLPDALNLSSRPPFHNTTLMFISILSFIVVMYATGYLKLSYVGWILLVAVISHHLRDSLHRGLWLWPVQLKPMRRFSCLLLTYCFPVLIGVLIHYFYRSHNMPVKYDDFIV